MRWFVLLAKVVWTLCQVLVVTSTKVGAPVVTFENCIAITQTALWNVKAKQYFREILILYFWICGYNQLYKFTKGNLVFANAGLSLALPDLLLALPGFSPVHADATRLGVDSPRWSPGCHQTSNIHFDVSLVLPHAAKRYSISPVLSGIWPHWISGAITSRHSQTLLDTKIHLADATAF
jgi:hypothetical protein